MEKTQTGHSRAQRRSAYLGPAERPEPSLRLRYLSSREFGAYRASFKHKILGVVAFGARQPPAATADCAFVWVDAPLPVLGGDPVFEVWTSSESVIHENADGIVWARDEAVIFGFLRVDEGRDLDSTSYLAYCRIFDFIDSRGYGHLLRVWNYVPRINDEVAGLERYRRFSVGRHDAFVAKQRAIGEKEFPAACAVGSQGGPMVIYFLAARKPGQPVENPRQTSAYRYPVQYGPRSPAFSRAMLMQGKDARLLFISGTSSIVGHETMHVGNVTEQTQETVANLLALIKQALPAGSDLTGAGPNLLLKTYLRHSCHLATVRDELLKAFGPGVQVVYLRADICRADLLLEVEGVYVDQAEPIN